MTGNDYSQRINIQGDVNQSSVVMGDSNQVSNQISQLGETEIQTQLKTLLLQLKTSIENDSILTESEQADALAEIGAIAHLAQSPINEATQKAVKRSLLALKGIILSIGEVTHLTETAQVELNAIAHLFNL